jgi:outer membrane protein assembly factor BamB
MKRITLFLFSLLLTGLMSCEKESKPLYEDNNLSIPWIGSFPDTAFGVSMTPIVLEDKVIVSATDLNTQREVFALYKSTGEVAWRWKDYRHSTDYMPTGESPKVVYKNLFIFNIRGYIYAIDHHTGKTAWVNTDYKYGFHRELNAFGGDVYYEANKEKGFIKNEIIKLNIETQKLESVFSLDGSIWGYTSNPIVRIENNIDTMMYFTALHKKEDNSYLMCFNLTNRKLIYQSKLTYPNLTKISGNDPYFYDDKIIVNGKITTGIEAKTGKVLWAINLEEDPSLSSVAYHCKIKNNYFFAPQQSIINVINLDTGTREFTIKDENDDYAILGNKIVNINTRKLNEQFNVRAVLNMRDIKGNFLFELTQDALKKVNIDVGASGGLYFPSVDTKENDVYVTSTNKVYKFSIK